MGDKGPTAETKATEQRITGEQLALAERQDARAQQLYDLGLPGLTKAKEHYELLASGDPSSIFRAVAPSVERVNANTDAVKKQISDQMPRGGERNLALEEADIAKYGQIGNLEAQAYENSFPALASISSGGLGLSINEISNAIAAFGGASSTANNMANQQAAGKAAQLGFFGSLAGAASEGTGLAVGCWIAEAIYGKAAYETALLRYWLNKYYKKTWIGRIVMAGYYRWGQMIAREVEREPVLGLPFRYFFRWALGRSTQDLSAGDLLEIEVTWNAARTLAKVKM